MEKIKRISVIYIPQVENTMETEAVIGCTTEKGCEGAGHGFSSCNRQRRRHGLFVFRGRALKGRGHTMRIHIVYEENEVCQFAAEELQKYILRLTGVLPLRGTAAQKGACNVYLGRTFWMEETVGLPENCAQLRWDGYAIDSGAQTVRITSLEARGVLYGVYRLLESVGCRWPLPGAEQVPALNQLRFPEMRVLDNPAYEVRAVTDDTVWEPVDTYVEEMISKLDWGCKNRLNTYYIGGFPDARCELARTWGHLKPFLWPALVKRGYRLECGGHDTPKFVDRRLFSQKPELFRMKAGVRRPDGNLCSSNPEAVEMIIDQVRELMTAMPELDMLHLFFDDVDGGSWCDCPLCRDKTPSQQMLAVLGPVADMLKKEFPGTELDFVLYHDTLDLSGVPQLPYDNIYGYYAPRERCYTHSIAAPDCPHNRTYYRELTEAGKTFCGMYIFEYYADMILWNKMGIDIPHLIVQDMRDYHAAGIRRMLMLMFGAYSWFAYPLNMFVYARAVWDPQADADALCAEYCRTLYGGSAAAMQDGYAKREEAAQQLLQFCEYEFRRDIRDIPPLQKDFTRRHIDGIRKAVGLLEQCEDQVSSLLRSEDDVQVRTRLSSEKALLEITRLQAACTHIVMDARYRHQFNGLGRDGLNRALDEAIGIMQHIKGLGESLPIFLIGVNGKGRDKFPGHLCDDQIRDYRRMQQEGDQPDRACDLR